MSEDDSKYGASMPTQAPRSSSSRVRFSPPHFDSTSSSSFSAFSQTWLAYIRVTELPCPNSWTCYSNVSMTGINNIIMKWIGLMTE